VNCGSAAEAYTEFLKIDGGYAAFAVTVGAVTTVFSFVFVIAHYNFLKCCKISHGGALELVASLLMNVLMIAALIVLTQEGSVAATITGDRDNNFPGTNVYLSIWVSTVASFYVTTRWKESKTLQFARAADKHNEDERTGQSKSVGIGKNTKEDDEDEDAI